jgi:hypothetical protein
LESGTICIRPINSSVRIIRFSKLFVGEDLVIADPGHALRSRQMGSVSAFGALGLSIRVDMQY